MLRRAASLEEFVADPIGSWIVSGTSLTWCLSPSRVGSTVWGAPDVETTRAILRPFEGLWAPRMGDRVDVILDASRVERVDPMALAVVVEWNLGRRREIVRVVRQQIGVIRDGIVGITLAGILPAIGDTHPFRVVRDALDAFVAFDPEGGEALHREVVSLVEAASGISPELRALRELLHAEHLSLTVDDAARALGLSTRSLQRALSAEGTSFQVELREARFARAHELLTTTDDKVAAIAHGVGVSEGALTQLVRERAGCTPGELRRTRRS